MADKSDVPHPDPAMRRLDRLVGKWKMTGQTLGSNPANITATTTFKWLHPDAGTGFFLQQDMDMDYAGTRIQSHELIGYNCKTRTFSSNVFSNMAAEPWPYEWDIQGDVINISIKHGPMNASFVGKLSADGGRFSGGWRPNAAADELINAPYDITATRLF